jgi:hypothetical protein
MKLLLLILIIFINLSNLLSQTCDYLDPRYERKFSNYPGSKFKKLLAKKVDPIESFNIAKYLRRRSDTLSKNWYEKTLAILKEQPYHKHLGQGDIFYIKGVCSFYLDEYSGAEIYFKQAISAGYPEKNCAEWYLAKIK